jgi:hypothetical protein
LHPDRNIHSVMVSGGALRLYQSATP